MTPPNTTFEKTTGTKGLITGKPICLTMAIDLLTVWYWRYVPRNPGQILRAPADGKVDYQIHLLDAVLVHILDCFEFIVLS